MELNQRNIEYCNKSGSNILIKRSEDEISVAETDSMFLDDSGKKPHEIFEIDLNIQQSEKFPKFAEFTKMVDKEVTPSPILEKNQTNSINLFITQSNISIEKNACNGGRKSKTETFATFKPKVILDLNSDLYEQQSVEPTSSSSIKSRVTYENNFSSYEESVNDTTKSNGEETEMDSKDSKMVIFKMETNSFEKYFPGYLIRNKKSDDNNVYSVEKLAYVKIGNSVSNTNLNNLRNSHKVIFSESSIASFAKESFKNSTVKTLKTVYKNTSSIRGNDDETDMMVSDTSMSVTQSEKKIFDFESKKLNDNVSNKLSNNTNKECRSISISTNSYPRLQSHANISVRKKVDKDIPQISFESISGNNIEYNVDDILNDYVQCVSTNVCRPSTGSLDSRRLTDDSLKLHKCSSGEAAIQIKNFFEFLHDEFPGITSSRVQEIIAEILKSGQGDCLNEIYDDLSAGSNEHFFLNINDGVGDGKPFKYQTDEEIENENIRQNSQVWRSVYIPPKIKNLETPPAMQTKPINFNECIPILISLHDLVKTKFPISTKLIPRSPILCPITSCSENIFVSEVPRHFNVNHLTIPMETISPRFGTNFFLEFKANRFGKNKCHLVYLIKDKVFDLGNSSYKNLYPILVMSTIVHVSEIQSNNWSKKDPIRSQFDKSIIKVPYCDDYYIPDCHNDQFIMLVWLTGLITNDLKVSATLTVWTDSGPVPVVHKTNSGQIYSIRLSQEPKNLYNSGSVIILSSDEVRKLTNNERSGLQFQLFIH